MAETSEVPAQGRENLPDPAEVRAAIQENPLWYHTMELAPGVVTPGWFDLRPIVERLPWPEVAGKRCLDVGTYDGFLAFELERRGASEVIATDISDHAAWDWPVSLRSQGNERLAEIAGPEKGLGFKIAKKMLGSSVERVEVSVYDLAPDGLGTFDVVVCGSLLLHLRDPIRALEAIHTVCAGSFLSYDSVSLSLTATHRHMPVAKLDGQTNVLQWWTPNAAGHRQMLIAAGFEIERKIAPFCIPFGPAHPPPPRSPGAFLRRQAQRVLAGGWGVPTGAVLARPGRSAPR